MTGPLDDLEEAYGDERPTDGYGAWFAALSATPNEDALFDTLVTQRPPASRLARQQLRGRLVKLLGAKFKEFGSAARPAAVADAWLREGDEEAGLQGQAFAADDVEPWAAPVAGAAVLDEASALLGRYVHAPAHVLDTLSLWAAYTHVFGAFGVSPLLALASPTKRCGKTTAL